MSAPPAPLAPHPDEVPDSQDTKEDVIDGNVSTCVEKHYSLADNFDEIVTLSPNADVLWPGALVQGQSIPNGSLSGIPLPQGPVTLTATTGAGAMGSRLVGRPSLDAVTSAMDSILNGYSGPTTAMTSYHDAFGYSSERAMIKLGLSAKWLTGNAKAALSLESGNGQKSLYIKFIQQYYTVAASPYRPQTAFAPGVSLADAKGYMSATNPPAVAAAVTYGRILIFKLSSSYNYAEIQAAAQFALGTKGVDVDANLAAEYQKRLGESTLSVVVLGGSAKGGIEVITSRGDKIADFLSAGANFSTASPAYPISYKLTWLKNNVAAKVSDSTTYTLRECHPSYRAVDVVFDCFHNRARTTENFAPRLWSGWFVRPILTTYFPPNLTGQVAPGSLRWFGSSDV